MRRWGMWPDATGLDAQRFQAVRAEEPAGAQIDVRQRQLGDVSAAQCDQSRSRLKLDMAGVQAARCWQVGLRTPRRRGGEGRGRAKSAPSIYTAIDADAAQHALEAFDDKWGKRFPVITQAWLNAWEYVTPFLAFAPDVRRVIYTTNAIEALNRQLRKAIKTKGHFPNEDAARKLIYLALMNAVPQWTRTHNWTTALLAFKDPLPRPPTRLEANPPEGKILEVHAA
jgi:hypothetical protein